ncbi:MAG: class I SAM-dependent methyltransferase [Thermodesulfobacteriota bacterium]
MKPLEWEKLYRETDAGDMPWYYPALDPDLEGALTRLNIKDGRALDIGTGPGTQALALAERGFTVTATDISEAAIELCKAAALKEGLSVDFIRDDILKSRLKPGFDIIFDRGCFHSLAPESRPLYVRHVHSLLAPKGVLFLKCFSIKETMEGGPYRFTPEGVREYFSSEFNIISIVETLYQGTLNPLPKALFAVMRAL